MPYQISQADRTSFLRCRRQWDFGAAARRNLEPAAPAAAPDLGLAFREALDVYYFPGMWDWQPAVTRPLVYQGLERSLARQRGRCGAAADAGEAWPRQLDEGRWLLDRYFGWAPAVDLFSPVQVQPEFEVDIIDPGPPPRGLVTVGGDIVRYRGTVDMLAVDAHDAYWIVRHRLVTGDWPPVQALIGDEEAVTACWAWEQFYLGMSITGTIYNEFRAVVPPQPGTEAARARPRRAGGLRRWLGGGRPDQPRRVRQHEPSGGGRSIPQHRRLYAAAREPAQPDRIEQHAAANFRRTWVRRTPAEVAAAGRRLAADAARMLDAATTAEPSPSDENCPPCVFAAPCAAVFAGQEPEAALRSGYRPRPARQAAEGRLGGGAWGLGRGAAPPRFPGTR